MARRTLDLALATIGLVMVAPLLAAIALAVLIGDGVPVVYRATRVGRHGRHFILYKFRTMTPSDTSLPRSSVTIWADPRVTRVGRVLRRLKLDELPQLFNVLLGNMTFVGPRPEDPSYVSLYTNEQRRVLSVKPGITGVAALEYSDEESLLRGEDWEETYRTRLMPAKLKLELDYLDRRTPWSDARILLMTFAKLLKHAPF
jgi:lipopolysaccharide/colanic/teichoic acid biosynthesis glycosyltransferase